MRYDISDEMLLLLLMLMVVVVMIERWHGIGAVVA